MQSFAFTISHILIFIFFIFSSYSMITFFYLFTLIKANFLFHKIKWTTNNFLTNKNSWSGFINPWINNIESNFKIICIIAKYFLIYNKGMIVGIGRDRPQATESGRDRCYPCQIIAQFIKQMTEPIKAIVVRKLALYFSIERLFLTPLNLNMVEQASVFF